MPRNQDYQFIKSTSGLTKFLDRASASRYIGFDTEFVSENRYKPELCLVQVATESEIVIIDALAIDDVTPFWEFLANGNHLTIAHAAREEFLFCYRAVGKRPANLFDVQMAAGFIGMDYPSSYGNLVNRLLRKTVDKGETRTDWKKRPLSTRQLAYAVSDVVHLGGLYRKIHAKLEKLDRVDWLAQELDLWMTGLEATETEPQWQRVSGITALNRSALAIVRELWIWRDREAERRNRAPKRILPDDLIVEIAKRGSADLARLKAIRGLENRVAIKKLDPIVHAVQRALDLPKSEHPDRLPRSMTTNLGLLGQFLTTALNVVCREKSIAPSLVATARDVRNLAAWRMGLIELDPEPELANGWRAGIVGQLIDDVLAGKLAIHVKDPKADMPLEIRELEDA